MITNTNKLDPELVLELLFLIVIETLVIVLFLERLVFDTLVVLLFWDFKALNLVFSNDAGERCTNIIAED